MNTTPETSARRIAHYEERIAALDQEIRAQSRRWRTLSIVRGLVFLLALVLLVSGLLTLAGYRTQWFWLAGGVFLAFLAVAGIHERIESRRRQNQIWRRLFRWSLARLNRDWDCLKQIPVAIPDEHAAICNDLDLFGRSSLFQLVGGVETPRGIELFRDWILSVPATGQVNERQAAIRELESAPEFRDRFRFSCHLLSAGDGGPDSLLEWAEAPRGFDPGGIRIWIARLLTGLMVIAVAGLLTGLLPIPIAGPAILALLGLNFLCSVMFVGHIHSLFNQVSTRHGEISHYQETFLQIRKNRFDSPLLDRLKQELFAADADVIAATDHLGRIAWRANLRRHGTLFLAYVVLQFGFLWDFHIIRQLQNWKEKNGRFVRRWFEILGQWEVLAALSQFASDHATWTTPEVTDTDKSDAKIVGQELGHPLLKHDERVSNDVQVGPSGSVLLVTGSNMSGKSTLLRAIGLNVVLAHLGAPVCAKSMKLSPMRIETSMRIQDSLADGVSFFMAELKRLKQIVDIARQHEPGGRAAVLFLLDEILQGTNSQERHIAVTRVVRHLIDHQAIGAVSTHDLELGRAGELADACRPVHFREAFETVDGKKVMTFDYQIRDGIATTTNALKLLELVGLDEAR